MNKLYTKKKPIKIIETVLNIIYLIILLTSCVRFFLSTSSFSTLCFITSLMLLLGDSTHLLPRIMALWDKSNKDYTKFLGLGKLIASLTMTIFYIGLWLIGSKLYNTYGTLINLFSIIIIALSVIRVIICLMPQNKWFEVETDNTWGIYRNIPFFIIGLIVTVLYCYGAIVTGKLAFVWLAVIISFACYIPVVLYSAKNTKIGMLMLPKSYAYVAVVIMLLSLI